MNFNNKSFDLEIQNIANKVRSDVEKELRRVFQTFDVVEHHPIQNDNPEGTSYSMKVKTDDKDQSHLRLHTSRPDPFSAWETVVDEFFRGVSPIDRFFGPFDPLRTGFSSIQRLADHIQSDVERELNRTFDTFDVIESHPILTDPEHTSYFMKVKTDDNGHVRVKTIKKVPGSDWETHVEEYNRGRPQLEGKTEENKPLENKAGQEKSGQKMETENVGRRDQPVEIKDEPYKGTPSTHSAA